MVNEHEQGKTTPRIKTGNCSIASTGSSSTAPGADSIYDKQMAWKLHGQRKTNNAKRRGLQLSSASSKDSHVAPAEMAMSPLPSPPSGFRPSSGEIGGESGAEDGGNTTTARLGLPIESQESSIQLHLARQERAREYAFDAQQKLASSRRQKDFTKVTTFEPFQLSVGNQKPRPSSASPTNRTDGGPILAPQQIPNRTQQRRQTTSATRASSSSSSSTPAAAAQYSGNGQQQQDAKDESWDKERSSLVSIIDAQRRELELREKAQQDALHVAESFATAIQSFEERLLVVEQTTSEELGAMRELLQRQSAATELILQSLGISQPPPAPSSLSASSSGSQSLARRETK